MPPRELSIAEQRKLVPCRYFAANRPCPNGSHCAYSHNPAVRGIYATPPPRARRDDRNALGSDALGSSVAPGGRRAPPAAGASAAAAAAGSGDIDDMSYEQLLELQERVGHVRVGVPEKVLARLPVTVVRSQPLSTAPPCTVCLEQFAAGDRCKFLPCRHAFHPACIDPWLREHKHCPLCKTDVAFAGASVGDILGQLLGDGPARTHGGCPKQRSTQKGSGQSSK